MPGLLISDDCGNLFGSGCFECAHEIMGFPESLSVDLTINTDTPTTAEGTGDCGSDTEFYTTDVTDPCEPGSCDERVDSSENFDCIDYSIVHANDLITLINNAGPFTLEELTSSGCSATFALPIFGGSICGDSSPGHGKRYASIGTWPSTTGYKESAGFVCLDNFCDPPGSCFSECDTEDCQPFEFTQEEPVEHDLFVEVSASISLTFTGNTRWNYSVSVSLSLHRATGFAWLGGVESDPPTCSVIEDVLDMTFTESGTVIVAKPEDAIAAVMTALSLAPPTSTDSDEVKIQDGLCGPCLEALSCANGCTTHGGFYQHCEEWKDAQLYSGGVFDEIWTAWDGGTASVALPA